MMERKTDEGRVGNWIMCHSGVKFYLEDPKSSDVVVSDIAHALSNYCRFTGHTREFYSVGTHSILCADLARKDGMSAKIQLYCLLHDDSEAYLGDISRPLKEMLPNYCELEEGVQTVVHEAFGLPEMTEEEHKTVKHYDNLMLANEIGQFMINSEDFGVKPIYNGVHIPRFGNMHVKNRFLEIFYRLMYEYTDEKEK
jgi:hypothetical protein